MVTKPARGYSGAHQGAREAVMPAKIKRIMGKPRIMGHQKMYAKLDQRHEMREMPEMSSGREAERRRLLLPRAGRKGSAQQKFRKYVLLTQVHMHRLFHVDCNLHR